MDTAFCPGEDKMPENQEETLLRVRPELVGPQAASSRVARDNSGSVDRVSGMAGVIGATASSRSAGEAGEAEPLSEFVKRRGWATLIVNELPDWASCRTSRNQHGTLVSFRCPNASTNGPSAESIGYVPDEIVGRSLVDLLHCDDVDLFLRTIAASASLTSLGNEDASETFRMYVRVKKKDGRLIVLELDGRRLLVSRKRGNEGEKSREQASAKTVQGDVSGDADLPVCFLLNGRPYPSRASKMLDSILQLRFENESLRRQVEEITAAANMGKRKQRLAELTAAGIEEAPVSGAVEQEQVQAVAVQDIATASAKTVEGGEAFPVLTSAPEEQESNKRKKKRVFEEPVVRACVECCSTDTPEWRKGPQGMRTLCNACGIRWAKSQKAGGS